MIKNLLIFGLFGTVMCVFTSSAFSFDSEKYCRELAEFAGGSYSTEETCLQMERKAKRNLSDMDIPTRIYNYCHELAEFGGGSYSTMESCVEMELSAKNRLGH